MSRSRSKSSPVKPPAKLADHFVCGECRKKQKFTSYVYANWDSVISATCDCGAKHRLFRGKATFLE